MWWNIQPLHEVCLGHTSCTPVIITPNILPVPQASDENIPKVGLPATQNTAISMLLPEFFASIYWNGLWKVYKENPPGLSISWVQIFSSLSCFHMQWWNSRGWIYPGLWETSTGSSAADPVLFQCFPKAYHQVLQNLEMNDSEMSIFSEIMHLFL